MEAKEMNTQEAIEFVKDEVMFAEDNYDENIIKKRDEVISLLQQGEIDKEELKKYRQMWEEFSVNEGDLIKVVNCIKHRYEKRN